MKIFAPDYYGNFRCLMGDCKHSCCIGWEIDVDEDTAEIYKNIPGDFGEKLRKNIDFGDECNSFRLCENGSCPFLNEKGLCEIIINLGEGALSQVCDDHPRFRNFFESRTEIGLGICCEAVAKLVLEKESKTDITEIGEDAEPEFFSEEEKEIFSLREKLFRIFQNRSKPVFERISEAFSFFGTSLPEKSLGDWAKIFLRLERLDEKWTEVLEYIKNNPAPPEIKNEISAEQLLCYFTFRHFTNFEPEDAIRFIVLAFYMTEKAAEQTGIFEAARLFSSEIEYSDENIEKIIETFAENEV